MKFNSTILNTKPYILPDSQHDKHIISKLDVIECNYRHHPDVINVFNNISNLHKYPLEKDQNELKNEISKYVKCDINNIIITHGSDNALKLCIETFIDTTSKILVPIPTYPHFINFIKLSKVKQENISYIELNSIKDKVDSLYEKLCQELNNEYDFVYLVNPNMPLGYMFNNNQIEILLKKYKNTLFIIDEAYIEFTKYDSVVKYISNYRNIIITRTFSKAFSLASLRLGYILSNIENINKMYVPYNGKDVTNVAMICGSKILQNIEYYKNNIADINESKDLLDKNIKNVIASDELVQDIYIGHGNFFIVKCKDSNYVCNKFREFGYIVRDKHAELNNCIRISIGTNDDMINILKIIKIINKKYIDDCSTVYIDLDGTIRKTAKVNSKLTHGIDNFIMRHNNKNITVVTNNTFQLPNEIKAYLSANNIRINNLITPYDTINKLHTDGKINNPFIIANDRCIEYLEQFNIHNNTSNVDSILLLNSFSLITNTQIDLMRSLIKHNVPIYIVEQCIMCPSYMCSETNDDNDVMIPDVGTYLNMLNVPMNLINIIGKETLTIEHNNNCVMIGDTYTDIKFAKHNNIEKILLLSTINKINNGYIEFNNFDHI